MIDQAIVYGDNKPYLVALLVLMMKENLHQRKKLNKKLKKLIINYLK